MKNSLSLSTIALLAAALFVTEASAATINLGANSGSTDAAVNVDLGGGNGGNTTSGTDATVTVNTGGGNGSLLDVGGTGSETSATVDLGVTGSATVDLFGTNDDANATIDLGGVNGSGVLDLFGNEGGSNATVTIGGTGLGGLTVVGTVGGVTNLVDLFGAGTSSSLAGGTNVASIDNDFNSACFMPNDAQIAKLMGRHSYTQSVMQSWAGTTKLKIVKVSLCPSTRNSLGGLLADNANISRLQDYLARFPAITAGLKKQGASPGDVIAVDRSGKTLVVYVI